MSDARDQLGNLLCAISMTVNFAAIPVIKELIDRKNYEAAGITFAGVVLYDVLFMTGCCYFSGLCANKNNSAKAGATVQVMPKDLESQASADITEPLLPESCSGYGSLAV
ncbi:MAG: hypothetical protein P1U63_05785 [Coxiellaceae bacterium]|nr:hypothetical protein [Coxiellaceae bacterium]